MGLDVDVLLLVGVDYSDVVDEKTTVEVTTKYNEDTGKPYEKKKYKTVWTIADEEFPEEWMAYKKIEECGLVVYEEQGEPVLVGLRLAEHSGDRIASGLGPGVSPEYLQANVELVQKLLKDLRVESQVTVYTFTAASY